PGNQFLGLEWLCEVIVGSRVEACDLVRPAVTRRQNEHGHLPPFLSPAIEDGESVDLRQAQVEDYRVVVFGRAQIVSVLAVGREVDGIARALESRAKLTPEIGFVFDD